MTDLREVDVELEDAADTRQFVNRNDYIWVFGIMLVYTSEHDGKSQHCWCRKTLSSLEVTKIHRQEALKLSKSAALVYKLQSKLQKWQQK